MSITVLCVCIRYGQMLYSLLKHFVKYSGTISGKHFIKGYLFSYEADMSCLNYSIKKHEDCKYVWVCSIHLINTKRTIYLTLTGEF